jgi:hypothetical protein
MRSGIHRMAIRHTKQIVFGDAPALVHYIDHRARYNTTSHWPDPGCSNSKVGIHRKEASLHS